MDRRVQSAWAALLAEHCLTPREADLALDERSLLEYLRSCLDGEDVVSEDLEALADVLCEWAPFLQSLERSVILAWLIELSLSLKSPLKEEEEEEETEETEAEEEVEREAIVSSSLSSSSSRQDRLTGASSSSSGSADLHSYREANLQQLLEIFPNEPPLLLDRSLAMAGGDLKVAIEAMLERLSDTRLQEGEGGGETEEVKDEAELKAAILGQYSYVDVQEDKKTYRPPPPKYTNERQRMRFLNGQSVDTRGNKYLEVKDPDRKDAAQPAFLKALKKYKKH